mgnify:CR=1 FL=1
MYDELSQYYQCYAGMFSDLDTGLFRTIRKMETKKDLFKKKMDEVARVLIKANQGIVKKSRDSYSLAFFQKFP